MESIEFLFGLLRSVLAVVLTPLLWSLFVKGSSKLAAWDDGGCKGESSEETVRDIEYLADRHEVGAALAELIQTDGAGSWPPIANHDHITWPRALRPYKEIYFELAPLLSVEKASLDDEVNRVRIANYRAQFRRLLAERVDLDQVRSLLEAADAGHWDLVPRDVYNAFYCCVSSCRHAYR